MGVKQDSCEEWATPTSGSFPEEPPVYAKRAVARRRIHGGGDQGLYLHSQILKIRDEDSHLGVEDMCQILNLFVKVGVPKVVFTAATRSNLPSSPLGGKTATGDKFSD